MMGALRGESSVSTHTEGCRIWRGLVEFELLTRGNEDMGRQYNDGPRRSNKHIPSDDRRVESVFNTVCRVAY